MNNILILNAKFEIFFYLKNIQSMSGYPLALIKSLNKNLLSIEEVYSEKVY